MPLTEFEIKSIKPSNKRTRLSDGGGLVLDVMATGAKKFRLVYRSAGKQKWRFSSRAECMTCHTHRRYFA